MFQQFILADDLFKQIKVSHYKQPKGKEKWLLTCFRPRVKSISSKDISPDSILCCLTPFNSSYTNVRKIPKQPMLLLLTELYRVKRKKNVKNIFFKSSLTPQIEQMNGIQNVFAQ